MTRVQLNHYCFETQPEESSDGYSHPLKPSADLFGLFSFMESSIMRRFEEYEILKVVVERGLLLLDWHCVDLPFKISDNFFLLLL